MKLCNGHDGVKDTTGTETHRTETFEDNFEYLKASILYYSVVVTWVSLPPFECTEH